MRQVEPRLEQLLADPMIRLMMASDRISDEDLRGLARRLRPRAPATVMRNESGCSSRPW